MSLSQNQDPKPVSLLSIASGFIKKYINTIEILGTPFIGIVFFLISRDSDLNPAESAIYGIFAAMLFFCMCKLVKIDELQVLNNEKKEKVDNAICGLASQSEELKKISEFIHKIEERNLIQFSQHLDSLESDIVKLTGQDFLEEHIRVLGIKPNGFALGEENSALKSYTFFWKRLVERQKGIGNKEADKLIARITHSNDIDIWNVEGSNNEEAKELLDLQGQFIKSGGIIVRILLGKAEEMNSDYIQVADRMKEKGIEVKYLCVNKDLDYDFLWVNGGNKDQENFVVKWFSGAGGRKLSSCEILGFVERTIKNKWGKFDTRLSEMNKQIESIPDSRKLW